MTHSAVYYAARLSQLRHRRHLYDVLETARRVLCCYTRDPCDCKYGINPLTKEGSEQTYCPELRETIFRLTGVAPFNTGQSVKDDLRTFDEWIQEMRQGLDATNN